MPRLTLKTKNMMLLVISTFILAVSSTSQAQNFYKWVDKAGSTHYTLTPPPASARKVSKVTTYNDRATSVVANSNNSSTSTAAEEASVAKEAKAVATESMQQTTNELGRIPLPPQTDANSQ